ncbi:MAG: hypothetical protein EOP10_17825 [Proteobacteria bacterium]|nr:MAG: hypothetical protein EOP10_17825 [Pseudomonadota bacterium]
MEWIFVAALAMLPGMKPNKLCPKPILVNIDLNHKIDRGVFKRTFMKCRRQYKKSPCLIKLMQPQKGAFQAICGETRTGLKDGIEIPVPIQVPVQDDPSFFDESAFLPNCSSEIFATNQTGWSQYQSAPILPNTQTDFCPAIEMRTEGESLAPISP